MHNTIGDKWVVKKKFDTFKKLKRWILEEYDDYEWTNEIKLYEMDEDQFMRIVGENTGLKFAYSTGDENSKEKSKEKPKISRKVYVIRDGYDGKYDPIHVCGKFSYLKKWFINKFDSWGNTDVSKKLKKINDPDEFITKCQEHSKYIIKRVKYN